MHRDTGKCMHFLYPPQRTASHSNTAFPPSVGEKKTGGQRREGREVGKPKITIFFVPCDLKLSEDGKNEEDMEKFPPMA